METSQMIQQILQLSSDLKVKNRILEQVQYFEAKKETALMILESLPDSMTKTSNIYKKRVSNYSIIINNLKTNFISYGTK